MLERAIGAAPQSHDEGRQCVFEPHEPWHAAIEEPLLIGVRQLHDPFEMEGYRFGEESGYLLERPPLYGKIEVQAYRLPLILRAERVAVQKSPHASISVLPSMKLFVGVDPVKPPRLEQVCSRRQEVDER